jgi:hypothetical protein
MRIIRNIVKCSLWIITIIVVYIIAYVGLGWFCPLGTSDNFERINNVALNLSYSYMAGLCFFILVEYLPRKVAQRKAFMVWENDIVNVYLKMSEMIAPIEMIYNINIEDKLPTSDSVKRMENYQPQNEIVYFCATTYLSDKGENGETKGVFVFHDHLDGIAKSIQTKISNMVKLPSTTNVDIELVETISEIESCQFIKICSTLLDSPLRKEHTMHEFGSKFYDFVQLYKRLSKYKFRKHSYKYRRLTVDEISAMKAEQQEVFREVKKQNIDLDNCVFYKNGIRYIVKNGKLIY